MAIKNKRLKLLRGSTYTFDVSDAALANNPLRFTADSGTTEYTDGITLSGANAQGLTGATLTFTVPASAPNNLNYYGGDDENIDDGNTNISNYTYDNVTFDTGTANINNMHWKPDGTKVYILTQASAGEVLEINLSTPWDLSTATDSGSPWSGFISQASLGGYGLHASTDGTKFYIMNFNNDVIYQYTLSTPWDISTASYANKSYDFGSSGYNTFEFNPTGTKIYVHDGSDDVIETHTLSTPWDISTASYDGAGSNFDHTVGTTIDQTLGITFSPDGTSFFVIAYMPVAIQGNIYQWDLTTPYDLSTASLTSNTLNVQNEVTDPIDIQFSSDGTKLYFVDRTNDAIYQYSIPSSGGASLKMGNHILVPGSAPPGPAYEDSAMSQSFFLDAIKAYGSDTNSYDNYYNELGGDFNDVERIATNGEYTLLADPGQVISHTGTGTTGTNTPVAGAGWTWLLRNHDGQLMKSWNGMLNGDTVNINTLDTETYYIGAGGGTPYYSKFHTCKWGSNVTMTSKYMFIGVQYRPTGGSNTSNNHSDRRAYISVYSLSTLQHVHTFALEDFYSQVGVPTGASGTSGGGTGWTESLWYSDDENLFVGAYASADGTGTEEGCVTWWDISDTDPANWSTNPDAIIRNPFDIPNNPVTNVGGTNYSNRYFGQKVNFKDNTLIVGHTIWLHRYTKSGSSFTKNSSLSLTNQSSNNISPGNGFMSTDNTNVISAQTSPSYSLTARNYNNTFSLSWNKADTYGGYPSTVRQLIVGKDQKVELAAWANSWAKNKAGLVSFIKTSDQTSVLELDNPFARDSDGLYFGQGLAIGHIDSAGSNEYSLVSWGEPNDTNTEDIISFTVLQWDSDTGALSEKYPYIPPISFGTTQGAIKFDTELDFSSNTNNPDMPTNPVWNNDGTKLFYLAGGSFSNTMQVFQMDVSTPYEISSIDSSTSGSILDLNTDSDFHNIFTNEPYGGAYDENNPLYLWFKPDGTKMYISGNNWDTVIQYTLDTPWDIMGGRTVDHKIGTGYMGGWSTNTMQNNWTYSSQLEMQNWYSHEWIKNGSSLVSGYANDRGASIEQTFSTPYDLSSVTSNFTASNIVDHTHTLYGDSDADGATFGQRTRKLGAANGGQFNHDGTERYFLHHVWNDSAFDAGGNGNSTMRVSLVKATLSTPYDITTMTYHSQVELTNLPGGVHSARPNGTISFSPDGRKLYWMSNADNIGGSDVFDRARLFQFSSTGDSAGSVFIREPDTSVKPYIQYVPPAPTYYGDRGMAVGGGWPRIDTLQYIDITTTGDATDFGDLSTPTDKATAASNSTRGLKLGGAVGSPTAGTTDISYWTFATTGNSSTFGNLLSSPESYRNAAVSNSTRAVVGGGKDYSNVMQYVTTDTTGDAQDFGDLSSSVMDCHSTNNETRGLFALGTISGGTHVDNIDYITIASAGNAQDFGDLNTSTRSSGNGIVSNSTTGIFMGGVQWSATWRNVIQSITIDTLGDASDFGDLIANIAYGAQTGNATRGVHMGGYHNTNYKQETIEYITIATPGNSTDFGDLLGGNDRPCGTSGNAA